MTIQSIKEKITPILKRRDVTKAAVFGSYARGDYKKKSDIDLLVRFKGSKSLLDLVGLKHELEDILGKKVDVLTYNSINHLLKDIILKEQKIIYGNKKRS